MHGSAGRKDSLARNRAVGVVLTGGKLITHEQCEWLVRDCELTGERIEDAIVYRSIVPELDLLKFLAAHHRTRFVSSERLSKADIDRATLAMVPRQVAETFGVFPVMFDAEQGVLSVVTADPDDTPVLQEIKSTSASRDLKAFLARPAAVRAAIGKFYGGDAHAFALLTSTMDLGSGSSRVVQRVAPSESKMPAASRPPTRDSHMMLEIEDGPIVRAAAAQLASASSSAPPVPPQRSQQPAPPNNTASPLPPPLPAAARNKHNAPTLMSTPTQAPAPAAAPPQAPPSVPTLTPTPLPLVNEAPTRPAMTTVPPAARPPAPSTPSLPNALGKRATSLEVRSISSMPPPSARQTLPPGFMGSPPSRVDAEAVGELVNVLVALLDANRQELRGHSSLVARLVRRLGERLNLPAAQVAAITLGAQLHDIGKAEPVHLTPLSVFEYESYRAAAEKALMTPTRLLGAANVPPETLEAIEQMYERYDGRGIPSGLTGKEVALGARIIAIADAYAELIDNSGNDFRRQLSPQEACTALLKYKGTIFDPDLLEVFRSLVLGDDVRAKLLSNRHRALLVDADAEETTVLELRLIEQGFDVRTVRSVEHALRVLGEGEVDLVVSELEIGKGDGLQLLRRARGENWGKDLAWVVYTRRVVRDDAQKAFELGVLDFVAKPAQPDVFVAKLKAMLEQRAAKKSVNGVSGSLREMGFPDLVQVLSQTRKTGSLRLRAGKDAGEVHFESGAVVNALWGKLEGTPAFYAMLKLQDGEFGFDPDFRPGPRRIHDSSEALLLEGLRRLDEGL